MFSFGFIQRSELIEYVIKLSFNLVDLIIGIGLNLSDTIEHIVIIILNGIKILLKYLIMFIQSTI